MTPNRTSFLVDGFNLYHSVVEADDALGVPVKWLNIRALCESFLSAFGPNNVPGEFYYFSAFAYHKTQRDPMVVARHQAFIDCLRNTGIDVQMARFKRKEIWCNGCQRKYPHHEEKETDVALAVKLIEVFDADRCDTAVLMTGDTDIAPAVRYVKQRYPAKRRCFLFPYKRKNDELARLGFACRISKEHYQRYQFPDSVTLKDGSRRVKPTSW
jgi:uncharacterized LabA/DUF88 family protein